MQDGSSQGSMEVSSAVASSLDLSWRRLSLFFPSRVAILVVYSIHRTYTYLWVHYLYPARAVHVHLLIQCTPAPHVFFFFWKLLHVHVRGYTFDGYKYPAVLADVCTLTLPRITYFLAGISIFYLEFYLCFLQHHCCCCKYIAEDSEPINKKGLKQSRRSRVTNSSNNFSYTHKPNDP